VGVAIQRHAHKLANANGVDGVTFKKIEGGGAEELAGAARPRASERRWDLKYQIFAAVIVCA
jgi:hypothetical protein